MPTHSIKLEIMPVDNPIDKKHVEEILKDIQEKTMRACNLAMNQQYKELMRKEEEKSDTGYITPEKEVYGKSFRAFLESTMKKHMDGCLTTNVAQTRAFVMSKVNFNGKKILNGEESLSTFKKSIPIIIHNKAYTIKQEVDGTYSTEIGLFNLPTQKELGVKRFKFRFIKPDDSRKVILNRIISGEYKIGAGQITYNERKKKWMYIIPYSFELFKVVDSKKILGVDLGIVNIATISIYNLDTKEYEKLSWKERMLEGRELIHYRQKIEARRKELSISKKWASDNKVGHGYQQRAKDFNEIADKYARFRETYNHKISRYIVDMAVKYGCGIIQMENLSGFPQHQKNTLLANWAYYDLQSKIEYKAKEKGITVRFVNPQYTSQRCSECGCIDKQNRNCKESQAKFECTQCPNKDNADINASKNIALPNIDEIIREQLKEMKTR